MKGPIPNNKLLETVEHGSNASTSSSSIKSIGRVQTVELITYHTTWFIFSHA